MFIIKSNHEVCFKDFIRYPKIEIQKNQMTFITGKSGCGKSSYLKMLNATEAPTRGAIYFDGVDLNDIDVIGHRRSVTLVPQEPYLYDGTIADNFIMYYNLREQQHISEDKIKEFLKLCEIDIALETCVQNLSVGERQRVFVAIFVSFMPKILILDEPTAALDFETSKKVFSNIKQFCKQNDITSVVVCHSEALTELYADFIIHLEKEQQK